MCIRDSPTTVLLFLPYSVESDAASCWSRGALSSGAEDTPALVVLSGCVVAGAVVEGAGALLSFSAGVLLGSAGAVGSVDGSVVALLSGAWVLYNLVVEVVKRHSILFK